MWLKKAFFPMIEIHNLGYLHDFAILRECSNNRARILVGDADIIIFFGGLKFNMKTYMLWVHTAKKWAIF